MTSEPLHCAPNADVLEAVALMVRGRIRHVPVVDEHHRLVGVVSDRDVREALGDPIQALGDDERRFEGWPVADIMSHGPLAIGPEASLAEAAARMRSARVGALVVVDKERRLIGMLSYLDLLHHAYA